MVVNCTCIDISPAAFASAYLSAYALVIGVVATCARSVGSRMHDYATECALGRVRVRQNSNQATTEEDEE